MANKKPKHGTAVKSSVKSSVKSPLKPGTRSGTKRSQLPGEGTPGQEQDIQRRLGNFATKGEHAKVGGRGGIVGQTTKDFRTDNKRTKSTKPRTRHTKGSR